MRLVRVIAGSLFVCLIALGSSTSLPAQKTADESRYPCRAEHTFDFWVGDVRRDAVGSADGATHRPAP